jgi:chromate reductase
MSNFTIAVVVGSLRAQSLNRALADALTQLAPAGFSFKQLRIDDLPLYNQDDDAHPAESVLRLKREVAAADGIVFVTPEYNRSIPGVLKNALDHASRPYGHSAWDGKPAGILGASIGGHGTAMAQQHLRNILAYLAMPTLTQPEAFFHLRESENTAEAIVASKGDALKGWLSAYANWVKQHTTAAT